MAYKNDYKVSYGSSYSVEEMENSLGNASGSAVGINNAPRLAYYDADDQWTGSLKIDNDAFNRAKDSKEVSFGDFTDSKALKNMPVDFDLDKENGDAHAAFIHEEYDDGPERFSFSKTKPVTDNIIAHEEQHAQDKRLGVTTESKHFDGGTLAAKLDPELFFYHNVSDFIENTMLPEMSNEKPEAVRAMQGYAKYMKTRYVDMSNKDPERGKRYAGAYGMIDYLGSDSEIRARVAGEHQGLVDTDSFERNRDAELLKTIGVDYKTLQSLQIESADEAIDIQKFIIENLDKYDEFSDFSKLWQERYTEEQGNLKNLDFVATEINELETSGEFNSKADVEQYQDIRLQGYDSVEALNIYRNEKEDELRSTEGEEGVVDSIMDGLGEESSYRRVDELESSPEIYKKLSSKVYASISGDKLKYFEERFKAGEPIFAYEEDEPGDSLRYTLWARHKRSLKK